MPAAESRSLIEALANSRVYQDYERAFSEATGLLVSLRPIESWRLAHHGKRNESPFCEIMSEKSRSCAACLQIQERLADSAVVGAHTMNCFAGLSDTAVPVRLGDQVVGFLQTGQVFRKPPTQAQFDRAATLLEGWGLPLDRNRLKQAFFKTRVISPKQHESVVSFEYFAQHLSMISNQVLVHIETRATGDYTGQGIHIIEHQAEDLSLGQVAKAVNTSTFTFARCSRDHGDQLHGLPLARAHREVQEPAPEPNLRISEIAFEVGFQSLTHFNRVFKMILGHSPTQYRSQLLGK